MCSRGVGREETAGRVEAALRSFSCGVVIGTVMISPSRQPRHDAPEREYDTVSVDAEIAALVHISLPPERAAPRDPELLPAAAMERKARLPMQSSDLELKRNCPPRG